MTRRLLPALLAVALLATLPACPDTRPAKRAVPRAEGEWVRPYDGQLPEDPPEGTAVFLVIDGRTRKPVAGATVRQHFEIEVGPGGWAPIVQEATTDEFGLVTLVVPEEGYHSGGLRDSHWSVHAEGYARTQEYGTAPTDVIELMPGRSRHGRLVDAMGRPLVGVRVGYKEGCGHSPFLVETTTDADGRFVLSGVDCNCDVFYIARGVLGTYFDGALRSLDQTPHTCVGEPAMRFRGRIVGADVDTLGARMVHALADARGAFARIGDDGHFVLDGLDETSQLTLWHAPDGGTPELSLEHVRPGGPFVWDLSHGDRDPTESDTIAERTLGITVRTPTGEMPAYTSVSAYRREDGRLQDDTQFDPDDESHEDSYITLALLPGTYDIVVGDIGDPWRAEPRRVTIGKDEPAPITIETEAQSRVRLRWEGDAPAKVEWSVAWTDAEGHIDHPSQMGEEDFIPPHAPARVAVSDGHVTRFFDVGPPLSGVRTAVCRWPAERVVRFRSAIEPASVWLGEFDHKVRRVQGSADRYEISTSLEGTLALMVFQEDGEGNEPMPYVRTLVRIHDAKDGVLDVGTLAWPPVKRGTLTLLDVEGQPVEGEPVIVQRYEPDGPTEGSYDYHQAYADARGRVRSTILREGAWALYEQGEPYLQMPIQGPGPWTLRPGTCTLEVEVHGAWGILMAASLFVDHETYEREDADETGEDKRPARFVVRGLTAGGHNIIVTAPGHRGEARRVILSEGQTRTIRVELPARK